MFLPVCPSLQDVGLDLSVPVLILKLDMRILIIIDAGEIILHVASIDSLQMSQL